MLRLLFISPRAQVISLSLQVPKFGMLSLVFVVA